MLVGRTSSVEKFSLFNSFSGLKKKRDATAESVFFGNVTFKSLNLKHFFLLIVASLLRNDALHNRRSPFHIPKHFSLWKHFLLFCIFSVQLIFRYRTISIAFAVLLRSHSDSPLLQQSAILMQMTTFYVCTIDCECMEKRESIPCQGEWWINSIDSSGMLVICYLIIQLLLVRWLKR